MMSSPSRTLTVVASASSRRGPPSMLTPEPIVSSSQEVSAAQASSSHAPARSGAPAWISMYCIVSPLPDTRQDPRRRGGPAFRHLVRRPEGGPQAMPQAEGTLEAEPKVPPCGGGLTRAVVRSPLLGGTKAMLALVHLVRQ